MTDHSFRARPIPGAMPSRAARLSATALSVSAGLLSAVLAPAEVQAQGFAAYVSPPRVEVQVQPGEPLRQVVELQHVGNQPGQYRFYTNDWTLGDDNAVTFTNDLSPDSCRPWVAIERRDLTLAAGARYRYRFEISPPAGTPPRECRFALMIEGLDTAQVTGDINFPVSGRIGVIVYAAVGGAKPELSLTGQQVTTINGQPTATLSVRNTGTATGRLEGFVNGTDASGRSLELSPVDLPILPGETRRIALNPVVDQGQTPPQLVFPLSVSGRLEWADQGLPIDIRFAP
jgi:hypothetical protein